MCSVLVVTCGEDRVKIGVVSEEESVLRCDFCHKGKQKCTLGDHFRRLMLYRRKWTQAGYQAALRKYGIPKTTAVKKQPGKSVTAMSSTAPTASSSSRTLPEQPRPRPRPRPTYPQACHGLLPNERP